MNNGIRSVCTLGARAEDGIESVLSAHTKRHSHTTIGPPKTPYEGGKYHGLVRFPSEYPFKPPSIMMFTPSGRFQTSTRLCLSISDFHPESWNPLWSVSSIVQVGPKKKKRFCSLTVSLRTLVRFWFTTTFLRPCLILGCSVVHARQRVDVWQHCVDGQGESRVCAGVARVQPKEQTLLRAVSALRKGPGRGRRKRGWRRGRRRW